jgi:hypothetical protein
MAAWIMAAWRPRIAFPFLALAAALAGCDEQELTSTGIVHPTLIEVSPTDFLAEVPCLAGPGAMQTYVVTLHDHGFAPDVDPDAGAPDAEGGAGGAGGATSDPEVRLPRRSNPVSCGTAVGFARVTPEHRYSVDIDAYDRADLVVHEPGVEVDEELPPPPVKDAATGETVAARWTTTCGKKAKTTARSGVVRRIRNCEPLVDHQPSSLTAVELRPELALGDATCGSGAGDVDHFEVTTPTDTQTLACGEPLLVADAVANRTLVLDVLAFSAGDPQAVLGSTCTAAPRTGVTVSATCSPFTDKGALEIDPAAAASALGLACDALRELTLTAPGAAPVRVRPSSCGSLVPVVGLARGDQTVAVVATPADGSAEVPGSCSANVVPGRRVLASCDRLP